jgi:hypothetical protein
MKHTKRSLFTISILSLVAIVALGSAAWNAAFGEAIFQPAATIPTFSIVSVQADNSVTIQTNNFPANDSFTVLMNTFGTRGEGGTQVETFDSGSGGSFTRTFSIPNNLKGLRQVAIRLESSQSGYYSYNWFWNNANGTDNSIPVTGSSATATPYTGTIPTFSISSVAADSSVTITTANFPANDTFDVLMNTMGTRGVDGTLVTSVSTGNGGTLNFTFDIPSSLKGLSQIAIRLQSASSGRYSYNWFWNNTNGGVIPATGGPYPTATPAATAAPIPTFRITNVNRDHNITIQTSNFPSGQTFNVTMGAFGTRGVGGTNVGTFNSGEGGTQSASFDIPSGLQGSAQIAIRLDSTSSGAYSYNWFWNNTYP